MERRIEKERERKGWSTKMEKPSRGKKKEISWGLFCVVQNDVVSFKQNSVVPSHRRQRRRQWMGTTRRPITCTNDSSRRLQTTRRLVTHANDSAFNMPDDTPFASNSERQCTRHKRHAVWTQTPNNWSSALLSHFLYFVHFK